MVSGYAGPLFTLRRDDGATLDVSPQAGGDYPDYAAIDAWAGGNVPTVATLHDQSGNGRHLTQATAANQPGFDTTQRFGNAVPILFDGFNRTATAANPYRERTLAATGLSFNRANASIFCAMQSQVSLNSAFPFSALDSGSTVVTALDAPASGSINSIGSNINAIAMGVSSSPDTIGLTRTATNRIYYSRGTLFNQSASNSSITATQLRIGRKGAGEVAMHALFGFAVYDSALSEEGGAAVRDSLNTAIGKPASPEYQVMFVGDSITEGTGSRLLRNTPRLVEGSLTKPRHILNMGVHGETQSAQYTNRVARYGSTLAAGVPNVAFIQSGTNDIGNGAAAATLYANTTTPFIAHLKGLGYKVVVCTLLPRANAGWTAAMETQRGAYNAAVIANAAGADAVLDLTANPTMGPAAASQDVALYPDNLHPSSLGYAYLAGAPSGTYADANTYYDALRAVLRSTVLGAGYVP